MEPLLVVNDIQELGDASPCFIKVPVFVAIDLVIFERFHEGVTSRVVVRIPAAADADGDFVILQDGGVGFDAYCTPRSD